MDIRKAIAKLEQINEGALSELAPAAEMDHEVQMARSQLFSIAEYAIKLHNMLKHIPEQRGIEGWMQAKITKAADYMDAVYHNLEHDLLPPDHELALDVRTTQPDMGMDVDLTDGIDESKEEEINLDEAIEVKSGRNKGKWRHSYSKSGEVWDTEKEADAAYEKYRKAAKKDKVKLSDLAPTNEAKTSKAEMRKHIKKLEKMYKDAEDKFKKSANYKPGRSSMEMMQIADAIGQYKDQMNEEVKINEISKSTAISALRKRQSHADDFYSEPDDQYKADATRRRIQKKFGSKTAKDAERGVEIDRKGRRIDIDGTTDIDYLDAKSDVYSKFSRPNSKKGMQQRLDYMKLNKGRFRKEEAELDEADTKFAIKHKKTKQVLSTHDNYNDAKDEHSGISDKQNYGIYKQTKKDAELANRNTYRESAQMKVDPAMKDFDKYMADDDAKGMAVKIRQMTDKSGTDPVEAVKHYMLRLDDAGMEFARRVIKHLNQVKESKAYKGFGFWGE